MKNKILTSIFTLFILSSQAQLTPEITSWVINTTGATGYNNIPSNVQLVQYTDSNVYVSATCIPGYDIGPWGGNPNVAQNQNFVYKITRFPKYNTGTPVTVGLGHTGIWSNGVSIFNGLDAMSYNNLGFWHQNAYFFEGHGFDSCLGHPQQNGEYHHHVNPRCLYDDADSTHHSPIIGYAFDGFPVYGAYGYANANGTGGIKRMETSYPLRNITTRDTLPNGTVLSPSNYGPAINSTYPLGAYEEDYQFIQGYGDLDIHNGRFCVTPDYPNGIYAYFVTIDSALNPVYPYVMGTSYYGTVPSGNTGPGGGHYTITESTTVYSPDTTTAINQVSKEIKLSVTPNPTTGYAYIYFDPASDNNITGTLYNTHGQLLQTLNNLQPSISYSLNLTKYPAGTYFLHLDSKNTGMVQKIIKVK